MYCFCATGFKHRVRCRGQLAKRRQSSGLSIAAIFGRSMQARSSEDALRRGKQKRRRRCLQPTELMTLLAPIAASCSNHHGQGAWARSLLHEFCYWKAVSTRTSPLRPPTHHRRIRSRRLRLRVTNTVETPDPIWNSDVTVTAAKYKKTFFCKALYICLSVHIFVKNSYLPPFIMPRMNKHYK